MPFRRAASALVVTSCIAPAVQAQQAAPSRQAMHDLLLPPPVPLWPATPAWYALLAIVLALMLWLVWRGWRTWRRNAYRRAALGELDAAQAPAEVAAILKRTALAAWPRADVASLSGGDWADFLRRTAPRARLTDQAARGLAALAYAPADTQAQEDARHWIRYHDARA
jgi:hypothetical protein